MIIPNLFLIGFFLGIVIVTLPRQIRVPNIEILTWGIGFTGLGVIGFLYQRLATPDTPLLPFFVDQAYISAPIGAAITTVTLFSLASSRLTHDVITRISQTDEIDPHT